MDAADDNELPRTRAEAKAIGSKHYFTGKPCKHGHLVHRYTIDGSCSECARSKGLRNYYANWEHNKARALEYVTTRYREDSEFRNRAKAYQKEQKVVEKQKLYQKAKRESLTEEERLARRLYAREYQRELCSKSPKARLNRSVSGGIYKSIVEGSKAGRRWETLVGYTVNDLMEHIEKQFKPGMTWENYGKWHIDHEVPKDAFNYETPEDIDFKRCWALSNLRPMWASDNISKGNKLIKPFQPSLLLATNDNGKPPQKETA